MSWTLFQQQGVTPTNLGGNAGTAAVKIAASRALVVRAVWVNLPAALAPAGVPDTIELYSVTGQALVKSQAAAWSGVTGWIRAPFARPVGLTPGADYMAGVYGAAGTFCYLPGYAWPVSNGPLTGVDGGYYSIGAPAYPASQVAGWNWGVDIEVSLPGQSGAVLLSRGM